MEKVIDRIVSSGRVPTRADIAQLLAAVGKPGTHRDEKDQAVRDLLEALGTDGHGTIRAEGEPSVHVIATLSSYEAY
jgi:hypothetical protein